DDVRVVVLTGAGRGFCAGADLGLLSAIPGAGALPDEAEAVIRRPAAYPPTRPDFHTRYAYFPTVPKPVIAALNGATAGLGLVIALYCDIRMAADTAVFTTAFSRRGLVAEHGISWILPRLIGLQSALDLVLSARRIDAAEALRLGLVSRVVPHAQLVGAVRAYARELADLVSPRSMRIMKRQLWEAQFQTLAEATAVADEEMRKSFLSADFKEGVAHFVEKRPPRFTGR
ncbi:MAG TPA: enoyl-CoA hydratase-related protein, partial [Methylomirabilota bacterium]|nr:enoyl-CoA hydratase-related protein [Methylomirabilota bacterium]